MPAASVLRFAAVLHDHNECLVVSTFGYDVGRHDFDFLVNSAGYGLSSAANSWSSMYAGFICTGAARANRCCFCMAPAATMSGCRS
jgi:pimeloyl-ACP methyl ester carboxylesterase